MLQIIVLLFLFTHLSIASILHVPQDYPTIQQALDALENTDTILVSEGVYAEALIAPPFQFVMHGDPSNYPVINPSALNGSNSLSCLTLLSGCSPIIENFIFVNGSEMYPRNEILDIGGVKSFTELITVFRNCIFDSTYIGIGRGVNGLHLRVELESCLFLSNNLWCVVTTPDPLIATNCSFSGYSQWPLVSCADSSSVVGCHFYGQSVSSLFVYDGEGLIFRNCVVGPCSLNFFSPIIIRSRSSAAIENNLTTHIYAGPLISAFSVSWYGGNAISFRNNQFQDIYDLGGHGSSCTGISNPDSLHGLSAFVEDNIFQDMNGGGSNGSKAFGTLAQVEMRRNRFTNLLPLSNPCVYIDSFAQVDNFRDNYFDGSNGFALQTNAEELDARFNWWGDSTGPFQASENPNGQGDRISEGVRFNPWYMDTLFLTEAHEPHAPIPKETKLEVYPNPFNPTTTISFSLERESRVKLEVFDVTGRLVKELVNGKMQAGEHRAQFDGESLASGIYFGRVEIGSGQIRGSASARVVKMVLMK